MQDVVELGLRAPTAAAQTTTPAAPIAPTTTTNTTGPDAIPLKGLVEAVLKVFSDSAPDAGEQEVNEFVTTLKDYRLQIAASDHEQEISRLTLGSLRLCEQFLKRSRLYYATREAELVEMIGILRQVAQHIAGDSAVFEAEMRRTTGRFKQKVQLDDIRELKKQLADEATVLQKTMDEKQKRDEVAFSALTERVETLQAHLMIAKEEASLDALTRIANRAAFDRALTRMVKAAKAARKPLTVAVVDVDHFKAINDTHGHPIGDRVLLCTAQWLSGAVRQSDVVARYGGEEFAAILENTDLSAAESRFRAVLSQIAGRSFEYEAEGGMTSVRFTVSCGVAQLTGSESEQELINRADQALYDAKRGGRNRVMSRKRSVLGGLFG